MFNGVEPAIVDASSFLNWLWWVLPGALFAVSLDVGQIASAASIRRGSKTKIAVAAKVVTFAIMAFFSYALQLIYLLHHVPAISLGSGLSLASQDAAHSVFEVCYWLLPGMLPLSIVLFTATDAISFERESGAATQILEPSVALALVVDRPGEQWAVEKAERHEVECDEPDCEWAGVYDTARGANNALSAHKRTHRVKAEV
jgi:hypothetical protein